MELASARLSRPRRRRLRITGEVSGGRRWFAHRPPPWSRRRVRALGEPGIAAGEASGEGGGEPRGEGCRARSPDDTHTTPRVRLADRLDREWAHLSHRREVVARARCWGVTTRPFASLDELVVLAGLTGPRATAAGARATVVGDDEADELLHRLVQRARSDWLAGRIVLQRILGGLLRIAGAEQRREPDVDALSLLVGEAWLAIARYRRPRPGHVAARLLNDARHGAFVGPRRRRRRRRGAHLAVERRRAALGARELAVRRAGRRAPSGARLRCSARRSWRWCAASSTTAPGRSPGSSPSRHERCATAATASPAPSATSSPDRRPISFQQ